VRRCFGRALLAKLDAARHLIAQRHGTHLDPVSERLGARRLATSGRAVMTHAQRPQAVCVLGRSPLQPASSTKESRRRMSVARVMARVRRR